MSLDLNTVLIIAGPTASGKSRLALEIVKTRPVGIINADSMQAYDAFPILSAQPDAAARALAPHYLFGTLTPPALGSAASWRADALKSIRSVQKENRLPIVVGGTGLYLEALMQGISDIPDVPEEFRKLAKEEYKKLGGPAFHEKLKTIDPETAARLAPGDTQRLCRAYEVYLATGEALSHWQKQKPAPPEGLNFTSILLSPPREKLYADIDRRFAAMIDAGALEEVRAAEKLNIPPDHPAAKTLGVRELTVVLNREMQLPAAIKAATQASRNYAKRQATWFKNRFLKKEREKKRQIEVIETLAEGMETSIIKSVVSI
jgi:tRNA dimethylallyltransferase